MCVWPGCTLRQREAKQELPRPCSHWQVCAKSLFTSFDLILWLCSPCPWCLTSSCGQACCTLDLWSSLQQACHVLNLLWPATSSMFCLFCGQACFMLNLEYICCKAWTVQDILATSAARLVLCLLFCYVWGGTCCVLSLRLSLLSG